MTFTSNHLAIAANQSTICNLFYGCKDGRGVVSNADSKTGVWTEAGETFDAGEIKAQTRGPDLHAESCFCLRLGAEWTIAGPRVGASVYFTCDAELPVDAKDSGDSVGEDVVLCKRLSRRGENRKTEVCESIEATVSPEFLADQD